MDTRKPVLFGCLLLTLLTLVTPVGRLFRRTELSYNEGWNIAAAMRLTPGAAANTLLPVTTAVSPLGGGCCQTQLYPAKWGWTTVNYPVLSFALFAALHSVTHDYLYTARGVSLVSLLCCAVLLALVARALGATPTATLLTGLLCVATFSICAVDYAGVDDPQLLGDAFFLLALFVYVRNRRNGSAEPTCTTIAFTAALFVIAGCVKQSPIDFPIAVFFDLLLLCRKRAGWFVACGIALGLLAVLLNRQVGGPWFSQEMLLGRLYSVAKARDVFISVLGPMLVPLLIAGWTAWKLRRDHRRRLAAILLVASVLVGGYFGGGSGVAGNALFTALFAIVLLLGLFFTDLSGPTQRAERSSAVVPRISFPNGGTPDGVTLGASGSALSWKPAALLLLPFAWLFVPALVQSVANPAANLRDARDSASDFAAATQLLQNRPGPALCESVLLCLTAGKPYVYDPFNATRLLLQGRLSEAALLAEIRDHRYSAIQLHAPVTDEDDLFHERFTGPTLAAINANYTLALHTSEMTIYVPRP